MGSQINRGVGQGQIILFIVGRRYERLERLLRANGYTVVAPSTSDQGVALCLHNRIAATLIDASMLVRQEDWSLPQSLKAVAPDMPVVQLVSRSSNSVGIPPGVDCVIADTAPKDLLHALRRCIG